MNAPNTPIITEEEIATRQRAAKDAAQAMAAGKLMGALRHLLANSDKEIVGRDEHVNAKLRAQDALAAAEAAGVVEE